MILKKIVGNSTGVEPVTVHGAPGFWIAGAPHVFVSPEAPPRLAGHVLVWSADGSSTGSRGVSLTKEHALRLAREIAGT